MAKAQRAECEIDELKIGPKIPIWSTPTAPQSDPPEVHPARLENDVKENEHPGEHARKGSRHEIVRGATTAADLYRAAAHTMVHLILPTARKYRP